MKDEKVCYWWRNIRNIVLTKIYQTKNDSINLAIINIQKEKLYIIIFLIKEIIKENMNLINF
jgi:hypothetical protein